MLGSQERNASHHAGRRQATEGRRIVSEAGIVDMRVRPPLAPWTAGKPQFQPGIYYPARAGFPRPRSSLESSLDLMFAEMDEAGVALGVIAGRHAKEPLGVVRNDDVAAVLRAHPRRFVGLAGVDVNAPADAAIAEIDRCLALGFRGVVIEPAAAREPMMADDPRLEPIYAHCAAKGVPVSVTLSAELVKLVGHAYRFASPVPLYDVARRFPALTLVVAHGAWPAVQEMLGIAFALPNVWVSPDLYMVGTDMPFAAEFVKAANLYLGDRMLFGTGYPSRGHVESVRAFDAWTFAPGVKDKVMRDNARRLLKIG
jgi:predicted TIM-barrel fold metal-dependent hydrolase